MTEHNIETASEEREPVLDGALSDGASADVALAQESSDEVGEGEEVTQKPDWQARYLAVEGTLADSLAFASLWAPYAKAGERIQDNPVYTRFLELRGKGLSVSEAFAAAGCDSIPAKRVSVSSPSKAHLFSGAPYATIASHRMSGEEMAIARELLGEGYSSEELEKLYRRVAKGQ